MTKPYEKRTCDPTDWRREPSERRNAILGKLAEEASALAGRCSRAMIQGLHEPDPGTGVSNLEHLEDEIADVAAMIDFATQFLGLDRNRIDYRRGRKHRYNFPWIEALPDNPGAERSTHNQKGPAS